MADDEDPAPLGAVAKSKPFGASAQVFWSVLAHLALPISSLATGPIFARSLGPEGRGEVASIVAIAYVAAVIAPLGLVDATTYMVARKGFPARTVVRQAVQLSIVGSLTGYAILFALAPQTHARYPPGVALLRWTALLVPLAVALGLVQSALLGKGQYRAVNIQRWVWSLARLVLVGCFAALGTLTVASTVWILTLTHVGSMLLLVWYLYRGDPRQHGRAERPRLHADLLHFGVRSSGGIVAHLGNLRLDQAVMLPLAGQRQLGYYAVAVLLAEVPASLMSAVNTVLFTEAAARDDHELVATTTRSVILLSAVGALLGALVAGPVVRLFFGADFHPAANMARVLFVAGVAWAASMSLGSGLNAFGRPGRVSLAHGVALLVTVIGLVILVPPFGGMGAALTSLVAYTTSVALTAHYFRVATGIGWARMLVPTVDDVRFMWERAEAILRRRQRWGFGRTP